MGYTTKIYKPYRMDSIEIKKETESLYKVIKDSEERLKELRSICKHENTFHGNYSYRVGASFPAIICSDCGELIKYQVGLNTKKTTT